MTPTDVTDALRAAQLTRIAIENILEVKIEVCTVGSYAPHPYKEALDPMSEHTPRNTRHIRNKPLVLYYYIDGACPLFPLLK